eukprot:GEMP01057221.1.p1 GENE.GEMP01057221.1~~GEMP01057221.1.p1  ORF type:complete len:238 (+),score=33.81 GEMP01057221.1:178-891(+)
MVRPLNQFCCGCSLPFGVRAILTLHLVQSVFYITTTVSNIVLQVPTFGYDAPLATQTFNAAFALIGLPFIVIAFWGVTYKGETYIRLYMYYLLVSFTLDLGYILYYIIVVDSCSMLPSALKHHGGAFACGVARIFGLSSVLVVFAVQIYFIFTVWSFAEDLKCGGSGQGFPDLLLMKGRKGESDPITDGLFGTGRKADGPYALSYGSLATPGIGGSTRLFGGTRHETEYPPRQSASY